MRKNLIAKIKNVLKKNIRNGCYGIFDHCSWSPNPKCILFNEDGVIVDICRGYKYFEIIGLTAEEFKLVEDYYQKLKFVRVKNSKVVEYFEKDHNGI